MYPKYCIVLLQKKLTNYKKKRSFYAAAPEPWNSLAAHIRDTKSLDNKKLIFFGGF